METRIQLQIQITVDNKDWDISSSTGLLPNIEVKLHMGTKPKYVKEFWIFIQTNEFSAGNANAFRTFSTHFLVSRSLLPPPHPPKK